MRHISMDYHFVWEQVQADILQVSHVSTKDQLVDIITKPLATQQFKYLTFKMQVIYVNLLLRGHIRASRQGNDKAA